MSILRVDSPFHFGWKHECEGGGTIQHIDLDVWDHDLSVYKGNKVYASMMLWKPEIPKDEFIPHPDNKTTTKPDPEVFMFGPDAM
tara:strand:- start:47 stop:301 length:255 start_codon:yes stop_codon:yes gene_type:complete